LSTVTTDRGFVEFARRAEPRLNMALTAAYGPEAGHEAPTRSSHHLWAARGRFDWLGMPLRVRGWWGTVLRLAGEMRSLDYATVCCSVADPL
jgi:hypothetical protein